MDQTNTELAYHRRTFIDEDELSAATVSQTIFCESVSHLLNRM